MLLIGKKDWTLESDRRLVKATDAATVASAADILAAAEADAARIREQAKAEFEAERQRGYEKGCATARWKSPCRSWISSIPPSRSWKASR